MSDKPKVIEALVVEGRVLVMPTDNLPVGTRVRVLPCDGENVGPLEPWMCRFLRGLSEDRQTPLDEAQSLAVIADAISAVLNQEAVDIEPRKEVGDG